MISFDKANLALQAVCPNNVLLMDDKNMPSVMEIGRASCRERV